MQKDKNASSQLWLWSGSALFLFLMGITLVTGARMDFDRARMLQFIGREELASASWHDLLLIHAQPLGFNALLKLSDEFRDQNSTVLLVLFITLSALGVWMTADITYRLTRNIRWGIGAGLLAGSLPGTTYYTLWVFYTLPVAFLLTTTVWGMVRASQTRSMGALFISVLAIVLSALTRSSIIWVFVIAWLLMNLSTIKSVLRQKPRPKIVSFLSLSAVCLGALAFVQLNSFASFGSVTLSSWGFENTSKSLQTTMTQEEVRAIAADDPCLREVLEVGVFAPIDEYPICSRAFNATTTRESPILTQLYWSNGAANMNHVERLSLSRQWMTFSFKAVEDDPTRVPRILFPSLKNEERGTIVRFFWPSSWYWLIDRNVSAGGLPTTLWILATSWVPVVMSALLIFGLLTSRQLWPYDSGRRRVFRSSATAVAGIALLYLFFETGENERFRVEIDWLLIALGFSVLGRTWRNKTLISRLRGRSQATPGTRDSTETNH